MQERKITHFVHLPEWGQDNEGGPVFTLSDCDTSPLTDLLDAPHLDYTRNTEMDIIPCVVLDGLDDIDERCIPDDDWDLPTVYHETGSEIYLQIADSYSLTLQEIVDTCETL